MQSLNKYSIILSVIILSFLFFLNPNIVFGQCVPLGGIGCAASSNCCSGNCFQGGDGSYYCCAPNTTCNCCDADKTGDKIVNIFDLISCTSGCFSGCDCYPCVSCVMNHMGQTCGACKSDGSPCSNSSECAGGYCCGNTCSSLSCCTPFCPDPITYCPGAEPDDGCGNLCPPGTKNCAPSCTVGWCQNPAGGNAPGTTEASCGTGCPPWAPQQLGSGHDFICGGGVLCFCCAPSPLPASKGFIKVRTPQGVRKLNLISVADAKTAGHGLVKVKTANPLSPFAADLVFTTDPGYFPVRVRTPLGTFKWRTIP